VPLLLGLAFHARTKPDLSPAVALFLLGSAVVVAGVTIFCWRQSRHPVLLTSQGVLDAKVSAQALPWPAIRDVETRYYKGMPTSIVLRAAHGGDVRGTFGLGGSRGTIELTALELTVRFQDLHRVVQQLSSAPSQ